MQAPPPLEPPKPRSRRGCLLSGCLSLLVIAILIPTCLYFYGRNRLNRFVEEFTSTNRTVFPELALSARQTAQLEERLARFQADLEAGRQPGPFNLTADELNALITREAWLHDKVRVAFSNDLALVQMSIPLQGMPIPMFQEKLRGRHLNATAALHFDLASSKTNRALEIKVRSVTLNTKTPPEDIKGRVESALANSSIARDNRTRKMVTHLRSIVLTNGTLTLEPGAPPP